MHCLFHPELNEDNHVYVFSDEEYKHLKALRLRVEEKLMLTNGQGLSIIAEISKIDFNQLTIHNPEYFGNYGELEYHITVGLGVLDNRDRMEFALEKCVELGAVEFYPIIAHNCQTKKINIERLQAKALAALKQCQRSKLPKIHPPVNIFESQDLLNRFDSIFLADINGINLEGRLINHSNFILVGPEGGFTDDEINFIQQNPKTITINLGKRRLRAETAIISMLALLSTNG